MAAEKKLKKETASDSVEKKLDRLIEMQEQLNELLALLTQDRCTCKKHRKDKKEKNQDKEEKVKSSKSDKKRKKEKK